MNEDTRKENLLEIAEQVKELVVNADNELNAAYESYASIKPLFGRYTGDMRLVDIAESMGISKQALYEALKTAKPTMSTMLRVSEGIKKTIYKDG